MLESVRKTGRVVIVHEAPRTCGYGAELAALIAEQALTSLQAPVLRVTGYDTPFPYTLEHAYLPDAAACAARARARDELLGAAMLLVVWEYRTKPERSEEFESFYRPDGPWGALMRQSPAFVSITLMQ